MENLKALMNGVVLSPYQMGLATKEYKYLQSQLSEANQQKDNLLSDLSAWENRAKTAEKELSEAVELLKKLKISCEESIDEYNFPELNDFLTKHKKQ